MNTFRTNARTAPKPSAEGQTMPRVLAFSLALASSTMSIAWLIPALYA